MQGDHYTEEDLFSASIEEAEHWTELLLKHMRQEITQDEQQQLNSWITLHPSNKQVFDCISNEEQLLADLQLRKQINLDGWWQKISAQAIPAPSKPFFHRHIIYIAVALVLITAIPVIGYYLANGTPKHTSEKNISGILHRAPGTNKATLTLADGSVINLNNAANGMLVKQGNTAITKQEGQLVYKSSLSNHFPDDREAYNVLSVPKGGQYQLTLPDNSKVWLNAASSIRYPTRFAGNERRVEITGEVYFEITSPSGEGEPANTPFIVDVLPLSGTGARVEVSGTRFNIMAYNDEAAITTTLLEGKLKVATTQQQTFSDSYRKANRSTETLSEKWVTLNPGEQALISPLTGGGREGAIPVQAIDTQQAVAWKNGFIAFKSADIKTIMRMISRWYNVEVGFEGAVPADRFTGAIPRNSNLSAVLHMLEYVGIHFVVRDQKIIVLPSSPSSSPLSGV